MWWCTRGAEIEFPSAENPELSRRLSFKPGVAQNTALHAPATARKLYLSNFYLPGLLNNFPYPLLPKVTGSDKTSELDSTCELMTCAFP